MILFCRQGSKIWPNLAIFFVAHLSRLISSAKKKRADLLTRRQEKVDQ
jgi:hypothetical protein